MQLISSHRLLRISRMLTATHWEYQQSSLSPLPRPMSNSNAPILKRRQLKRREVKYHDQEHTAVGRSSSAGSLLQVSGLPGWPEIPGEHCGAGMQGSRTWAACPMCLSLEAWGQLAKRSGPLAPVHPPLPVHCPGHFTLLVKQFQLTSDSHIYH